jgi:S1-C subfamily serine protease
MKKTVPIQKVKKQSTLNTQIFNYQVSQNGLFNNLFVLAIIASAVVFPAAAVYYSNYVVNLRSNSGVFVVDTNKKEVKQALAKQLIYKTKGTSDFYSPKLNIHFTYSPDTLKVTDTTNTVLLTSLKDKKIYTMSINQAGSIDQLINDLERKYAALYDTVTISKSDETPEYTTLTVKLTQYLSVQEITHSETVYVSPKTGSNYLLLSVPENQSAIPTEINNVLVNSQYNPGYLEDTVSFNLEQSNAVLSFDRKKWRAELQSPDNLWLSYLTSDERDKRTLQLSVENKGYNISEQDVTNYLTQSLVTAQNTHSSNHFTIIDTESTVRFNSIDFKKYTFTRTDNGQIFYHSHYITTASNKKSFILIKTITSRQTPNDDEFNKVISSIKFLQSNGQVSSGIDVLGENAIIIEKAALIGKLSTVKVFSKMCSEVQINMPDILPKTSAQKYSLCSAGFGSGFYVTSDGVIATNAHVAAPNAFDTVMEALRAGNDAGIINDIYTDVEKAYTKRYPLANKDTQAVKQDIQSVVSSVLAYGLSEKKVTVTRTSTQIFVENGIPFDIDKTTLLPKDPDNYLKTELIGLKELDSEYEHAFATAKDTKPFTVTVPDLALLKVTNGTGAYPALTLADHNTISAGATIFTIGYPGLANSETLFSDKASTIATITKGSISAVKPSSNDLFKIIQIDATISSGNSGGPIINTDGKVIGISTYGISSNVSEKDYNAGISVEELKKFLNEKNITNNTGTTGQRFSSGLNNLLKGYYQWAISDFETVRSDYPLSADTVDPLIAIAQEKIDNKEDNTPVFSFGIIYLHKSDLFSISTFLFILGIFFISVIIFILVKRKQSHNLT